MKKYYIYKMNLTTLNIISIIIMLIICIPLLMITSNSIDNTEYCILMLLLLPYCILHEIIHSIFYVINGANFKNIIYGIHLEKGVLCCLCKQNITKKNILISLIAPFSIIGVITLLIGLLINNDILIWLSAFNIIGCSGDLVMFFDFIKLRDFKYTEFDDPTAFALYGNKNLKDLKLRALTYVDEKSEISKTNNKKVTVSKVSVMLIIIYLLIIMCNLLI